MNPLTDDEMGILRGYLDSSVFSIEARQWLRGLLDRTESPTVAGEPGPNARFLRDSMDRIDRHRARLAAHPDAGDVAEPEADVACPDCGHQERHHGPTGNPAAGCWDNGCVVKANRKAGIKAGTKCHRGRPFPVTVRATDTAEGET